MELRNQLAVIPVFPGQLGVLIREVYIFTLSAIVKKMNDLCDRFANITCRYIIGNERNLSEKMQTIFEIFKIQKFEVLQYLLYIISVSLSFPFLLLNIYIYKSMREKKKEYIKIEYTRQLFIQLRVMNKYNVHITNIHNSVRQYVKVVRVIFTVHHLSRELSSIAVSACILDGSPRNSVCEIAPRCIITRIRFCSQQSPPFSLLGFVRFNFADVRRVPTLIRNVMYSCLYSLYSDGKL